MATRKITKIMAEDAATEMAKKVYDDEVNAAHKALTDLADKVVKECIPAEVLEFTAKYSDYIDSTTCACIASYTECGKMTDIIPVKLSYIIPTRGSFLKVGYANYSNLDKLYFECTMLQEEITKLKNQIYNALIALETDKNIEKSLPEALEYLHFPAPINVPATIYNNLRLRLKAIKKNGK